MHAGDTCDGNLCVLIEVELKKMKGQALKNISYFMLN